MSEQGETPERIWLQQGSADYRDAWTWCWHEVDETDVEYVRADVFDAQAREIERLRKALENVLAHSAALPRGHQSEIANIARRALATPSTPEEASHE